MPKIGTVVEMSAKEVQDAVKAAAEASVRASGQKIGAGGCTVRIFESGTAQVRFGANVEMGEVAGPEG